MGLLAGFKLLRKLILLAVTIVKSDQISYGRRQIGGGDGQGQ
jgi:hypothetical protein